MPTYPPTCEYYDGTYPGDADYGKKCPNEAYNRVMSFGVNYVLCDEHQDDED